MKYPEIEFVCHNSNYPNSYNATKQRSFYYALKKLEKEYDYGILPYMQDFSDESHTEISLAVIILDIRRRKILEKEIRYLMSLYGAVIDQVNSVGNLKIDEIVQGSLEYLITD